jgi:hypothetical protein
MLILFTSYNNLLILMTLKAAYWNRRNHRGECVPSGVYFYTFQAGDFTATRKLMIAR